MDLKPPATLKLEHQELHTALQQAARLPGKTGDAVRLLLRVTDAHFAKEEELALPPLSILPELAAGKLSLDMPKAIVLAEKLNAAFPDMLAEHRAIVAGLEELLQSAGKEGHPELVDVAQRLMLHIQIEEQVTYPMAIVIGEYLKLKFGR
jgi:hypothetical protein